MSSSNSSSSRTSVLGAESISSRISSEVSSSSSFRMSAASSGRHLLDDVGGLLGLQRLEDAGLHLGILDFGERVGGGLAVDGLEDRFALGRAEFLDDVGEIGRVHLLQLACTRCSGAGAAAGRAPPCWRGPSGSSSAECDAAAARIHCRRHDTLQQRAGKCCGRRYPPPARSACRASASVVDPHRDVVDPHHLAALDVDDLLVERSRAMRSMYSSSWYGDELLVAEEDAVLQLDGAHLVVADREPGVRRRPSGNGRCGKDGPAEPWRRL